jgi:hypothetical protein
MERQSRTQMIPFHVIESLETRQLLSVAPGSAVIAQLFSPMAGSLVSYTELNHQHSLEMQFDTPSPMLDAQSVLDKAPEFTLSGAAAAKVKVVGRPSPAASAPPAYIYHFTGSFGVGEVQVNFLAGSFADVAGDLNVASTQEFVVATDLLKGFATRNGLRTPVAIRRTDGGLIDPNAVTWLLIHGRGDTPAALMPIADALGSQDDQILTVNWSAGASYKNEYTDFTGQDWIKPVGVWSAEELRSYGFASGELNIIGHSWGADVGDELAGRLMQDGLGKVQSIVALDAARGVPATLKLPGSDVLPSFGLPSLPITITFKGGKTYNQDNPGEIDFAAHANVSWSFRMSVLGSAIAPSTASEAFAVDFPTSTNPIDEHDDAIAFFASLLLDHNPVTAYFSPSRLLGTASSADPWKPNQFSDTFSPLDGLLSPGADQIVYEAQIPTTIDSSGNVQAAELQYISSTTGSEVDVLPTNT